MEAHLQSLIDYFAAHAQLALAAIFLASFLEAVAVIGTIVPGSSVVFAGGVLIGLLVLDPWLAAAAAILGAIIGDGISYWLGHRYRDAIGSIWPLRKHPALLARGHAYFALHGGKSIFLGRFLGPVRAIVPVIAGMAGMSPAHFYAMNVLSAIVWAAAHLVPGALFGASLQLAGAMSSRLLALVALVIVSLWLLAAIVRALIRWGLPHLDRLRGRVFARASAATGPLARALLPLLDPARRESLALLVSAAFLVGGAWLFLGVVEDVVTNDSLVDVDRSLYTWLQGVRTDWGDALMVTLTELGSAAVLIPVIAAVALWLALTRRLRTLAYWVGAAVVAELLVTALKFALGRARPDTAYAAVDTFALPSGHAALNFVVYGFLAFLLGNGKPGWQQTGFALSAAVFSLLVAFSRLYLGAHWFSDVVASFGLGLAWIALLSIAYLHHVRERPLRATPVLLIVVTTLALVGGSYAETHYANDLALYAKPAVMRALRFDAWQGGEWRTLSAARAEIGGQVEEPLSVQWAATPEAVERALAGAGWQAPAAWTSDAALLWLLPSTPIGELPVLPKFHRGQAPALTLIRPADARTRTVLRLWRVAEVSGVGPAGASVPLLTGILTLERSRPELGLIETARTVSGAVTPDEALADALRDAHVSVVTRDTGQGKTLLVW